MVGLGSKLFPQRKLAAEETLPPRAVEQLFLVGGAEILGCALR